MLARSPSVWFAPLLIALLALQLGCTPKYPKCKKDSHCTEQGEVCVEGLCQQCRDNDQCSAGEQCNGGRCEVKAECGKDTDCSGGKVCKSGKCAVECAAASDCGAGLKCVESRCRDENFCVQTGDCGPGMSCQGGRCSNTQASTGMDCTMADINFDFNRSQLTAEARDQLSAVADCMKTKGGRVTIEGHCDERGTEEYNLSLGEDRARVVRKFLVGLGVPSSKLRILTKGELQPLDDGHNEAAWARNRRAGFIEE